MQEIDKLPLLDRDPLGLVQMMPGVVQQGNSATVINGLRTSYSNMTLDGINIQDNYLRDNALDYTPNRILLGQIRQMTLVTSNQNAAAPVAPHSSRSRPPSGTNTFHGSAYWYNRNNDFAANDWFNNQAGVANPRLNQNQAGGTFGGPIKKDKLFFYTNYEAVRTNSQLPQTETILTDTARQGIFTYQAGSAVRTVNLLTLRNIAIDPYMAKLLAQVPAGAAINNFDVGDSTPQLLRNTAGYRYNQRNNEVRDNVTTRLDYNLSSATSSTALTSGTATIATAPISITATPRFPASPIPTTATFSLWAGAGLPRRLSPTNCAAASISLPAISSPHRTSVLT